MTLLINDAVHAYHIRFGGVFVKIVGGVLVRWTHYYRTPQPDVYVWSQRHVLINFHKFDDVAVQPVGNCVTVTTAATGQLSRHVIATVCGLPSYFTIRCGHAVFASPSLAAISARR